jgi:hypothetical protein
MAGAYRTENDLVLKVLANLGVLAPGQPVDVEDFNNVQVEIDSIRRTAEGFIDGFQIPDINQIPGVYFSSFADIVTGEVCVKFGSTPDDRMMFVNKGLGGVQGVDVGYGAAAKTLRAITRGRPTGQPLQVDYF